jgi:chloramphenicol 3-O-phosphotransferase
MLSSLTVTAAKFHHHYCCELLLSLLLLTATIVAAATLTAAAAAATTAITATADIGEDIVIDVMKWHPSMLLRSVIILVYWVMLMHTSCSTSFCCQQQH